MSPLNELVRAGLTLAIALGGGTALFLAGLPAAWLTGGVLAVAAAEFRGFRTVSPAPLRDAAMFVLGLSLGASVSPETLGAVGNWPFSIAMLVASVVAGQLAGQAWLVRRGGWSRETAFFATVPGALTVVMMAAEESRADLRLVAIAQMVRFLVLVALLPLAVTLLGPHAAQTRLHPVIGLQPGLLLLGFGLAGALLFRLIRAPMPVLLGPLVGAALAYGGGLVSGALPPLLIVAATVVLATTVGARFRGVDFALLRRASFVAITGFGLSLLVAFAFAGVVAVVSALPLTSLVVAFAPGSLDTMLVLALSLDLDTAFVATHHLVRFLGISFLLPVVIALVLRPTDKQDSARN